MWFKVDDSFHSHPKVMATEPAALGLWVVAGTWSSANLTDGFVPDYVLPRLAPDSATLARKLVAAGLWTRTRGGYLFHDWNDYNFTAEEVAERKRLRAEAGRKGGQVRGSKRSKSQANAQANAKQKPSTVPVPEPEPSVSYETENPLNPPSGETRPNRCERHKSRPKDWCDDCHKPPIARRDALSVRDTLTGSPCPHGTPAGLGCALCRRGIPAEDTA
ncbi:MAG: hypothetical protein ACRDQA_00295 [Nocardioidaceae bacterium]